jgi:biopolymer transport protein ExbD
MGVTFTDVDDEDDFDETHEINVTPFIDVVLVLLIVFMVAAPLSTVDLPVDLPTSSAVPHTKPDKPTYVSIKADLAVAIGETPVKRVDWCERSIQKIQTRIAAYFCARIARCLTAT